MPIETGYAVAWLAAEDSFRWMTRKLLPTPSATSVMFTILYFPDVLQNVAPWAYWKEYLKFVGGGREFFSL